MPDIAFETIDALGYNIVCTKERWSYIIAGHDELENRQEDVKNAIASPYKVFPSKTVENRYVACCYNTGPGKSFIKAVVSIDPIEVSGSVTTAYTAMEIGGENIDASRQLYP